LLGITADQFYLHALKTNDLYYYQLAKILFPFEKELLVGEAHAYINFKIVNEKSLKSIETALIYDPYSAEMLSVYMQYSYILGDKNKAVSSFYKLKRISPNAPIIQELIKRGAK